MIIGAGGVGVNAIQGAALAGALPIIAVDVVPRKLPLARTFGATHAVDGRQSDLARTRPRAHPGSRRRLRLRDRREPGRSDPGARRSSGAAARWCWSGCRPRGRLRPSPSATSPAAGSGFSAATWARRGSACDVPRLVARYREGRLNLDELITARYPLERINEAIGAMEGGEALRNVIVFPAADAP